MDNELTYLMYRANSERGRQVKILVAGFIYAVLSVLLTVTVVGLYSFTNPSYSSYRMTDLFLMISLIVASIFVIRGVVIAALIGRKIRKMHIKVKKALKIA